MIPPTSDQEDKKHPDVFEGQQQETQWLMVVSIVVNSDRSRWIRHKNSLSSDFWRISPHITNTISASKPQQTFSSLVWNDYRSLSSWEPVHSLNGFTRQILRICHSEYANCFSEKCYWLVVKGQSACSSSYACKDPQFSPTRCRSGNQMQEIKYLGGDKLLDFGGDTPWDLSGSYDSKSQSLGCWGKEPNLIRINIIVTLVQWKCYGGHQVFEQILKYWQLPIEGYVYSQWCHPCCFPRDVTTFSKYMEGDGNHTRRHWFEERAGRNQKNEFQLRVHNAVASKFLQGFPRCIWY